MAQSRSLSASGAPAVIALPESARSITPSPRFSRELGKHIVAKSPLPKILEDGPYTLLRLTTQQDYRLAFAIKVDGDDYSLSTRLVLTPHFSYYENFLPQFRMSPQAYKDFAHRYPMVADFLQTDPRLIFQKPAEGFIAVGVKTGFPAVMAAVKAKSLAAAGQFMQRKLPQRSPNDRVISLGPHFRSASIS